MVMRNPQPSRSSGMVRPRLAMVVAVVLLAGGFACWKLEFSAKLAHWASVPWSKTARDLRPLIAARRGDVRILDEQGRQLPAVDTIEPGSRVRTGRNSYALLRYAGGTSLQLRGETLLAVEPDSAAIHLTLISGGIYAEVEPQPADHPLIVNPGRQDCVEVVGTRFELEKTGKESVLRVAEGQVRFGAGENSVEVGKQEVSAVVEDQFPVAPRQVSATEIWQGWQHGLLGEYYAQGSLDGEPVMVRIDPRLNFDWRESGPDRSLEGPFHVIWTGEIEAPRTSDYTFHTVAHYGFRLWLDGQSLNNSKASMGGHETSRPVHLEKGKRYSIKIEYNAHRTGARMQLLWSSPDMPLAVIDQQWLYPAPVADD